MQQAGRQSELTYRKAGETAGENIDDSTIHTEAIAAIVKDPDAQYFKIDVTVTRGDVVLAGLSGTLIQCGQ